MQRFGLGNTNNYNVNQNVTKVNEIKKEINDLKVSDKEKALTLITSILISLITFSGLVVFAYNMIIYYDLYLLVMFVLFLSLIGFIYLTNYLYLLGITKKQVKNIKSICLNNLAIYGTILFILLMLVFIGGY